MKDEGGKRGSGAAKKLTLARETVKVLSVRTGVKTGFRVPSADIYCWPTLSSTCGGGNPRPSHIGSCM